MPNSEEEEEEGNENKRSTVRKVKQKYRKILFI